MDLIKSLDSVKMLPNKVLIEYFNKNQEIIFGTLKLITPVTANYSSEGDVGTGRGKHLERTGKVIAICDKLKLENKFSTLIDRGEYRKKDWVRNWNWITSINVSVGQWVWFPSSVFDNSPKLTFQNRKLMVVDYHQLYMSETSLLNGYILAENVKKKHTSKLIQNPWQVNESNIYCIYDKGHPIEYTDIYEGHDVVNNIQKGDLVITRFETPYPLLEEKGHNFYSDKELHIFQTKEILAKLCKV
jgi:hypothetical protein